MATKNVFLSSTGRDLHDYRGAAYRAIEGLEGYHCVRMEDFGAVDAQADDLCRRKVQECDVFVGIVGHLHGSCPPDEERSYTEREYDAACEADIPRLIFLAPEDFPLAANLTETDTERARQQAFRQRVSEERVRDTFQTPHDLASRVTRAIHNWEQSLERAEAEPAAAAGTRPAPPQPYFAHAHTLQANFTGRVRERTMLTEWLTTDDRPVLAVVAFGGMGKSALSWAWLQRDLLGLPLPGAIDDRPEDAAACRVPEDGRPEGAFWWSFYERDSTFEGFLNRALAYAAGGRAPKGIDSAYEKMEALVNLLRERRLLLVLDGFERLLRQYASLAAVYQKDKEPEKIPAQDRSCTDPHAAKFLRWLAGGAFKSRILLTSRLFPRELEGDDGQPLANCRREDLTSLHPQDAVAFFHAEGVTGTRAEIEAACRPYGYQPLALRLLAGAIRGDHSTPGDIRAAERHGLLEEPKGERLRQMLEFAYDALDRRKRPLLSRIAAFRSAVDHKALSIFNHYKKAGEFDGALDELADRGLLFRDRKRARYDLHPLVRAYAYDRLAGKKRVHERLMEHFGAIPVPDTDDIKSVEELTPVIELYHHTVGAGRYDDAFHLYSERLAKVLFYQLGAYQITVELLRSLFPEGETKRPRLGKEGEQAWTLNTLANSYSLSGQSRRALPLLERVIVMCERLGDENNAARGRVSLADSQLKLGHLAPAESELRNALDLDTANDNEFEEAVGHAELGRLLAYRGARAESDEHLKVAAPVFDGAGPQRTNYVSVVRAYRALAALLAGDAEAALSAARQARELADEVAKGTIGNVERDFIRAEWLIGTALVALGSRRSRGHRKHLREAEPHLSEALTRCRRINMVDHEPAILLSRARWHHAHGHGDQARDDAQEALAIADRCEYRLQQADIHNFLAALALDEDPEAAAHHATTAYKRAWCDGPPHAYKPALEEAERLLTELGVEPPPVEAGETS